MEHSAILQDIAKGNFQKIYFLHGEEPYYIDLITDKIVENAIPEDLRDFGQVVVYGKEIDSISLIAELNSLPMLGDKKLVILKEAQQMSGIESLENYFEKPNPSTIFVINYKYSAFDSRKKVFKAATKSGLVFKSDKIKEYQLNSWIQNYVKSQGYGITPKAAQLLTDFLGNDISKIVNELSKLALLIEKGTTINDVHVEENIGISKDYNVFELSNAIAARDTFKAFQIVDYFQHNPKAGELIVVVNNLFSLFNRLMRIHFMPNKSNEMVAGALKVHPFVATQMINASKLYDPKKLAANIAILHEFDLKSKGVGNAGFDTSTLLKEMVFRLLY